MLFSLVRVRFCRCFEGRVSVDLCHLNIRVHLFRMCKSEFDCHPHVSEQWSKCCWKKQFLFWENYLTCRSVVRISSNAFASSGLLAIAIPSSVTFLEVEFILDKKFALLVINQIVFLNLRERFLLPLLWGTLFYRRRWLLFKRIHFSVARIWLQLSSQRKIFCRWFS